MTQSTPLMTDSNIETNQPEALPKVLNLLPNIPLPPTGGMIKIQQHLDLLMLAIEALQLGGSEYMLAVAKELELNQIVKNRVSLWRLRCTNPWRQCYTRDSLTLNQAKTLVIITGNIAKRLNIPIRQLVVAVQKMKDENKPMDNNFRIAEYLRRFQSHFEGRMNPRRAKVSVYLSNPEELSELAVSLLEELLFCSGTRGMERFWISLFDGEVK